MHRFKKENFSRHLHLMTYAGFELRIPRAQANTVSVRPKVSPRQIAALLPPPEVLRIYTKNVVQLLNAPYSIQFVLRFDPADRFRNACARPEDATNGGKALPAETVMV